MEVKTVTQSEAERADILVCIPAEWDTPFDDNVVGKCNDCGRDVQFRPHAPKEPTRVCVECVSDRFRGGRS